MKEKFMKFDEYKFEEVRELLDKITKEHVHFGSSGATVTMSMTEWDDLNTFYSLYFK